METSPTINLVKSIPCFTGLDSEALELFLESARERVYGKGELMLREGEACPGLFILRSGSVKLFRTSSAGNEQIMRVVSAGGCFECAPLFDRGPNPVSAEALETSKTVFIPATSFDSLMDEYPRVVMQLVPVLAMRLRDLLNTVEDFSFKSVSTRIAKLLLQLGERQEDDQTVSLRVPLTQHHLACLVGCSRQVLNGYLQELVKKGIIKIENRRIIVLEPERLVENSSDEPV